MARSYSDFLTGRYAALTNDPNRAAEAYSAAASSNPNNRDILERAVFSSLISGNVDNAIIVSKRARTDTLDSTDLPRLVLGVDALSKKRGAEKATGYFDGAMGSQFNGMLANALLAWSIYGTEGIESAERALLKTESADPLINGLQRTNLALLKIRNGDDEEALEILDEIWMSGIRLAVATEHQARLLDAAGQTDDAVDLLETFSLNVGQNAAIDSLLEQIQSGRSVEVRRPSLQEGAALAVYIPAAALAVRAGDDLASVYFTLALHLDPELHVAKTLWADALDQANRRQDAMVILDSVPETSVFYATAQGQLAWIHRREGLNEESLAIAETALSARPDRNLKIQLGDLFRSLGRYEDAEQVFSEIIANDTEKGLTDWRLLYARGAAREQLQKWPRAEADLLAALELAPEQPSLLNYLGYSWIDRGENLEKGFEMIQRAVDLRPDAGYIIDSLGWAYYRLGRYEEAVEQLERAVALEPGEAVLNDHLGDAYWRVGRHLEATFQWSRAIQLDPESQGTELLHAKVENGLDDAAATVAANNALPDGSVSP
ncbi:MAG: tetratricopeptide repeat protein [Pseudomonadota bacterium]